MSSRKLVCAALSALFIWMMNAGAAEETGKNLILIEEEEPRVCAAAAEQGLASPGAEDAAPAAADAGLEELFEEKGLTLGESAVAYPVLKEGAAENALREKINDLILEDGKIRDYVTRISQLISGGKLTVSWRGTLLGPVFSFACFAEGAVKTPRNTFVWTGGNIDLRDGHEVTAEEIFTDPEAAREIMEAYLEETVAPEMSAHLLNSLLTPLPELFRMTERGLIWMYPIDDLSTLSDRAGDVLVPWDAVWDQLNLAEDGVLSAMGLNRLRPAAEGETLSAGSTEAIRQAVEDGVFPGIPVRLGESLQPLTDSWRMLIDPDVYTLGRMFSLEGAPFQRVFLTTDYLSESWENSTVDGIRADLGGLYGLTAGITPRECWIQALGEPDHSLTFDGEKAEAWRTVPGVRDYYEFGDHRLQLHADEEGILTSIVISQ